MLKDIFRETVRDTDIVISSGLFDKDLVITAAPPVQKEPGL